MVLKGGFRGYTIPLDSPLYQEPPWIYRDVEALIVLASVSKSMIEPIIPEGVEVANDPVTIAFWLSRYPFTTLGAYDEALIALQVVSEGELAYYIPYIYVTSDAALAAGREVAGAPKKLASIKLSRSASMVHGELWRGGVMLLRVEMRIESQADEQFVLGLLGGKVPLLSLRIIPRVGGSGGYAELVKWHASIKFRRPPIGGIDVWTGQARVRVNGSIEDPLDRLGQPEVLAGLYGFFDMTLNVDKVLKRYEL